MKKASHSSAAKSNAALSQRVLVVDDEQPIVDLLTHILRDAGYECVGCPSGPEALHLIQAQGFDAVLCDIHMAGMNGIELLKRVRAEHSHTAFVIVTGEGDIRVGVEAMREGAADYLLKPLDIAAVVACVRHVLERKEMEEKLENYHLLLEEMVEQRTEQLRKALSRIERNYEETLQALATALELRDLGTAGHTRRVMTYAVQIAKEMDCTKEEIHSLTLAALLHDMGKIGIPDAILLKTSELSPEERAIMQTHVTRGYELLRCIGFLGGAAEIILAHHEHFDGGGYPHGVKGEEIPIGARIFAVADALASITSDRPYRWAKSLAAARKEIIRETGKQFDPAVVSAFLSIDPATWEELRGGMADARPWAETDIKDVSAPRLSETLHLLEASV
jgi:response regulator RpfG family c-di-GMP phosphodiesterase